MHIHITRAVHVVFILYISDWVQTANSVHIKFMFEDATKHHCTSLEAGAMGRQAHPCLTRGRHVGPCGLISGALRLRIVWGPRTVQPPKFDSNGTSAALPLKRSTCGSNSLTSAEAQHAQHKA